MTPRQKKRLARASAKGHPLAFIRRRAVLERMSAAVDRTFKELMIGGTRMAEAVRDHIARELIDLVLRPMVRRVVRDAIGVMP